MSVRCEPPPEFADRPGWHWIKLSTGIREPWRWAPKRRDWWTGHSFMLGAQAAGYGHRYYAPIADPPRKPWKPAPLLEEST